MSTTRIPPTPEQRRWVNIGMVIQFHLAAIGHLAVWLYMLYNLLYPSIPEGWTYKEWYGETGFITEIFVTTGIPISFGILVAVYILFRCLLAYTRFGTALRFMITIDVIHAILMCWTIFVPARLAIPIVLYSIACYHYYQLCVNHLREDGEFANVS